MKRRLVHFLLLAWLLLAQSIGAVHQFAHVQSGTGMDVANSVLVSEGLRHDFDQSLCPWVDALLGGPALLSGIAVVVLGVGARQLFKPVLL